MIGLTNHIGELARAKEALEREILNLEQEVHICKMERLELETEVLVVISEKKQRNYEYK